MRPHPPRPWPFAVLLATLALPMLGTLTGCNASGTRSGSAYSTPTEGLRDTAKAERLNREAADLIDTKPERAKTLLREALTADLYCGPAHNNLGVLYLAQGKLYEAANEFEWARKLLPGHPDPRLNLALVFESAGRYDQAVAMYTAALEVYPEHLPTAQALTRLQVRSGRTDDRTPGLLEIVALRSEDPAWRDWARLQLAMAR